MAHGESDTLHRGIVHGTVGIHRPQNIPGRIRRRLAARRVLNRGVQLDLSRRTLNRTSVHQVTTLNRVTKTQGGLGHLLTHVVQTPREVLTGRLNRRIVVQVSTLNRITKAQSRLGNLLTHVVQPPSEVLAGRVDPRRDLIRALVDVLVDMLGLVGQMSQQLGIIHRRVETLKLLVRRRSRRNHRGRRGSHHVRVGIGMDVYSIEIDKYLNRHGCIYGLGLVMTSVIL